MSWIAQLRAIESRAGECRLGCWIGHGVCPAEGGELLLTALADGLDELRVPVTDEVLKRICLAILLAHKDQRDVRRQEQQRGGQLELIGGHERRQAVARRTVPDP